MADLRRNYKVKEIGRSFWQFFRLIFVLFFLYLMGDAFFRWDGFRYYASLSEFLPSLALAAVFSSIITFIIAIFIWIPFRSLQWFILCLCGQKRKELFFLFIIVLLFFLGLVWGGKRVMFPYFKTSLHIKIAVSFCVLGTTTFLTWLLRDKSGQWIDRIARWVGLIQNRITPLVWLFGMLVFLSVPLVAYHTWFKGADQKTSKVMTRPLASDVNRPNIILVTFDAMSARDMSVYGYQRDTTPFITQWAKTATVFTKAEAESNYTAPTTASLMTGKRVWTHLRYSRMQGSEPVKTDIESLPLVLKNNGYYNMAFIANIIATVNNLGVAGSFDLAPVSTDFWLADNLIGIVNKFFIPLFADKFRIHNWFVQGDFITSKLLDRLSRDIDETSYPPDKAFNKLLTVIEQSEEPIFGWVHLNPPHTPYLPPEPYMGMFDQSEKMRTLKSHLEGRQKITEYLSTYQRFPPEIETLRARYDEFIRYADKQFEDFINRLKEQNRLKNTIIILSSDHGEIFEHNSILHGSTLYEPETNIPLIIKEPDQTEGRTVNGIVEQIDIPATILDLAGIRVPSWMEGRSLVPLMRGAELPPVPVFSMNLEKNHSREYQITAGTIAVWEGDYKMIHYLEKGESLLFNLKSDPDEMINVIESEPETARHLFNLIYEHLKMANEKIVRGD